MITITKERKKTLMKKTTLNAIGKEKIGFKKKLARDKNKNLTLHEISLRQEVAQNNRKLGLGVCTGGNGRQVETIRVGQTNGKHQGRAKIPEWRVRLKTGRGTKQSLDTLNIISWTWHLKYLAFK